MALLVLGLQYVLGARLNPRWRYALWLLVLARLLMPLTPESHLSFYHVFPSTPTAFVPIVEPYAEKLLFPENPLPTVKLNRPIPLNLETGFTTVGSGAEFNYVQTVSSAILTLAWLAGVVLLSLLTWQVNRRFGLHVAGSPEVTNVELQHLFAEARAELAITRRIRLIESAQVRSPAIMGLFRPRSSSRPASASNSTPRSFA